MDTLYRLVNGLCLGIVLGVLYYHRERVFEFSMSNGAVCGLFAALLFGLLFLTYAPSRRMF